MSSSDQEAKLNSLLKDLHEKVFELKTFDRNYEVSSYCDELEIDIQLTIDSAIAHMRKIETEHLAELRAFRESCTSSNFVPKTRYDKFKPSLDLLLTKDVPDFSIRVRELEESTKATPRRLSSDAAVKQADELLAQASELRGKMMFMAFHSRIIKYKTDTFFQTTRSFPGRLVNLRYGRVRNIDWKIGESIAVLDSPLGAPCVLARFLTSDQLALASSEGHIALLNPNSDPERLSFDLEIVPKLDRDRWPVTAMAESSVGLLLVGNAGISRYQCGIIYPGSSTYQAGLTAIVKNSAPIVSIQPLTRGRFATLSLDNSIDISDPIIEEDRLRMTGHGSTQRACQLGKLSNEWLVTCSTDDPNACVIRVWDPVDCRLVKEKPAGLNKVCALAVLSTDQLVLASLDGSVKLVSLADDTSADKFIIGPKEQPNHAKFIEVLPNDDILIADSLTSPQLQIWDPQSGQLIQSMQTHHTGAILSCYLSPRNHKLVTTSLDGTVGVWKIWFESRRLNPWPPKDN